MKQHDQQKMIQWIDSLPEKVLKTCLETCLYELHDAETIRLTEQGVPYWEASGENIDGSA